MMGFSIAFCKHPWVFHNQNLKHVRHSRRCFEARVTLGRPVDATIHELSAATHVVSPLIGAKLCAIVAEWKWIGAREIDIYPLVMTNIAMV